MFELAKLQRSNVICLTPKTCAIKQLTNTSFPAPSSFVGDLWSKFWLDIGKAKH